MRITSLLIVVLVFIAGCDTPPGPALPLGRAPVVSDFQFTPAHVDLADADTSAIEDGRIRIPVSVSARVEASEGNDVAAVRYLVRRPDRSAEAVAEGELIVGDGGAFSADFTVSVSVGAIGNYPVVVYAVDDRGRMSNQVSGMLRYRSTGGPPVIEDVLATPNPFSPPGELVIVVTVSDPDGLDNIARVLGVTPTGSTFELFDDGEAQGDEEAGDGRYTARFDVPSATPGDQTFVFQAVDRTGLESEVVEYTVTIQ